MIEMWRFISLHSHTCLSDSVMLCGPCSPRAVGRGMFCWLRALTPVWSQDQPQLCLDGTKDGGCSSPHAQGCDRGGGLARCAGNSSPPLAGSFMSICIFVVSVKWLHLTGGCHACNVTLVFLGQGYWATIPVASKAYSGSWKIKTMCPQEAIETCWRDSITQTQNSRIILLVANWKDSETSVILGVGT